MQTVLCRIFRAVRAAFRKDFNMTNSFSDFNKRTDLADEVCEIVSEKKGKQIKGLISRDENKNGFSCHVLEVIDENGEKASGKPVGRYFTVDIGKIWLSDRETFKRAAFVISEYLRAFIPPKDKSCLLAALGNKSITADATGPITAENFIVTRHIKSSNPSLFDEFGMRETLCVCPGVSGNTGIEAAEIIKGAVELTKPDFVIAVDSLSSMRLSRLACTVQISNTGISPGSGINNARKEISMRTLGVPVISIGVPTVVDASTLAYDILKETAEKSGMTRKKDDFPVLEKLFSALSSGACDFFVTPKETDRIIKDTSKLIGYAINLALNDNLAFEDIDEFIS